MCLICLFSTTKLENSRLRFGLVTHGRPLNVLLVCILVWVDFGVLVTLKLEFFAVGVSVFILLGDSVGMDVVGIKLFCSSGCSESMVAVLRDDCDD
ncbi:MAG TPA: hypothetical protein DCL76_05780 [Chloroflexi bacterium]|nr:hypothetical protein [Chloroflexota bacterium]HCU98819.1 hypothetical protein [Chloroflexota bacterium]